MFGKNAVASTSAVLLTSITAIMAAMPVNAADYSIDPAHSFIEFRTQHLGYSWLYGRFNTITGEFSHDPDNPEANKIKVDVDITSVDTNHPKRDDHLRSADFLDVEKQSAASFVSSKYTGDANKGTLEGELTLNGVTQPISLEISKIGEGDDPWGGYRAGFEGNFILSRADYKIDQTNLGPGAAAIEMTIGIEGIRK